MEVVVNIENAMILFTVTCDIDIGRGRVMSLRGFWGQGWDWAGFGVGWGISRRVGVVGVEVGVNIENAMILFTAIRCDY